MHALLRKIATEYKEYKKRTIFMLVMLIAVAGYSLTSHLQDRVADEALEEAWRLKQGARIKPSPGWFALQAGKCNILIHESTTRDYRGWKFDWSGVCIQGLASGVGILKSYDSTGRVTEIATAEFAGGMRTRTIEAYRGRPTEGFLSRYPDSKQVALADVPGWARELTVKPAAIKTTLTWPNGNRYEGDVVDGREHGKGTFTWPSGDRYEGNFVDGYRSGQGKYSWPDGGRKEGHFVKGKLWNGKEFDARGNLVAEYSKGAVVARTPKSAPPVAAAPSGSVGPPSSSIWTYTWPNGDRYEGEWMGSVRTGKGKYFWANGDRYEGDFVNAKMTGSGTRWWANGDRYVGTFIDDRIMNGTLYDSRGVAIANFRDGTRVNVAVATAAPPARPAASSSQQASRPSPPASRQESDDDDESRDDDASRDDDDRKPSELARALGMIVQGLSGKPMESPTGRRGETQPQGDSRSSRPATSHPGDTSTASSSSGGALAHKLYIGPGFQAIVASNRSMAQALAERWGAAGPYNFPEPPRIVEEFQVQRPYFAVATWHGNDHKRFTEAWAASGATAEEAARDAWGKCQRRGGCRGPIEGATTGALVIGDIREGGMSQIHYHISIPGTGWDVLHDSNVPAGWACAWTNTGTAQTGNSPMRLYGNFFFQRSGHSTQRRFEFDCRSLLR